MQALKFAATVAGALTAFPAAAQQAATGPDNRYLIRLTVDGVPVKGSQELEAMMSGKPKVDQDAIQAEPILEVIPGQVAQLSVSVTDPHGTTTRYTRGKRIGYQTFGCLSISSESVMTVTGGPDCTLPDYPRLFVVYNDRAGNPVSYSEFVFKVRQ